MLEQTTPTEGKWSIKKDTNVAKISHVSNNDVINWNYKSSNSHKLCASLCCKNVKKNETSCEGKFQFCKLKAPEGKKEKFFHAQWGNSEKIYGILTG